MSIKKYTISSKDGATQATIVPERGAFISSLILPFPGGARETVFLHEYAFDPVIKDLPGGIPFLFPICGRLSRDGTEGVYLYDGQQYSFKIHGFSWFEQWNVTNVSEDTLEVVLNDNANTRECYPFCFEIKLIFKVTEGKLQCRQQYYNREKEKSMPYYAGFHPYFLIPDAKETVILDFHARRRLKYNNQLTDIIGEQPTFNTPVRLSDPEINEQLCILGNDKRAMLTFPNGDVLHTNAEGFSYLQLYHISSLPFFCVERWMGFPNALNSVSGVRWLGAGEMDEALFEVFV